MEETLGIKEKFFDQILGMSIIFILSLCINFIEDPSCRKWYSSIIGTIMSYYSAGSAFIYTMAMFVMVWLVIKKFDVQKAYYVGNTVAFSMLLAGHIYQMYYNIKASWGSNMIFMAKANMVLTNLLDGQRLQNQVEA